MPRFRVIVATGAEPGPRTGESPRALVRRLAIWKARQVADRLRAPALVIGSDTVVVTRAGRILGKPGTAARTRVMLAELSGTWHRVYTGMAVIKARAGQVTAGVAVVRVKMRRLSVTEIARLAGRHRDKAGGYAVQARRDPVIEKVVGEYEAVVGLSLRTLRRLLGLFRYRPGRRGRAPSRRASETRA